MSLELMSKINDNYHLACAVHREIADTCWFIYAEGYAMLNEFQLLSESTTQRKIKRYISSTYQTFVPDVLPKSANISATLLEGKNREALKMDDSWKILKQIFQIWRDWEKSSLKEYQRIAKEIDDSGEMATADFVKELIKDVKEELVYVTDKIISLTAMDWDMPTIIAEQPDYVERYKYLIDNFHGEPKEYHHYNSNLDAKSRMSLLDKYPK